MNRRINEIQDDEFRVIGKSKPEGSSNSSRKWLWVFIPAAVILVLSLAYLSIQKTQDEPVADVFDSPTPAVQTAIEEEILPIGKDTLTTKAFTEHITLTVNDIPLSIYIPHNATPKLSIGTPDIFDKSIVLVTQAADIRADNGKINGAFVIDGKPLAWGLSKKGFVAIIDGKITIGVAENSPLFEEATEKGGYFFRQYPLVDNGVMVENEQKGKAIRKAICDRAGEIMVIMSEGPESFHDFSQALVDLRIDNAVYLVGSESFGYFRDKFDHFSQIYLKRRGGFKYENYIEWR